MEDLPADAAAEPLAVAARILEEVRLPLFVQGHELYLGASIGFADSAGVANAELLLQQADAAMYAAKSRGKNRVECYEPTLLSEVGERLQLLSDLQYAVRRGEIVLHYQPMMDLQSAMPVGLEALARWMHPRRGLIQPAQFIPLAEESGLIVEIGRHVLRAACAQANEWAAMYPDDHLMLSVNVSPRQLQDRAFASDVAQILEETAFPAERLVLEITESVMMQDTTFAKHVFDEIHALGVRFAVDDFGTGYSSLGYLRRLPFDILKIDKSFVEVPQDGTERRELTRAIVDLARTLQLSIVAEGIEQPDQVSKLRALACDIGQGYLFSRPLDPNGVRVWLESFALRRDTAA
jgi:EAL domain-containing protein (putative c-di-GMP-specific phosphodiesterase class I)